jgi:hypothetical protein
MENNIFDDHAAYSRYLSIEGMRVNDSGTKPSIYITEIKLKRAIKEMSHANMEEINNKELSSPAVQRNKEVLLSKIENLQEWQLLQALHILIELGRIECVTYISLCKKSDKEPN